MSTIVHKMNFNVDSPNLVDPVCGTPPTNRTLYATLKVGRGYRWCKRCLMTLRGLKPKRKGAER